ncbi:MULTISPECIES: glycosyltransferase family 4 protein [unclassified Flavobacterium]|uniref:glycosyltransferase family 4 protein n=1 Tax=unclassified Flavobacterium TaxID=196869 RepID=UPI00131D4AE4|nr:MULTISPECIES: glycosyltransferase family 4 protein [unclassified Flavobacterium]
MNILILTREYKHDLLPGCGGTGSFYTMFSKELVKKGHSVYVFGIAKTNIEFKDEGVHVKFEKNLFKKSNFYNLMRSISGKIKCLQKLHFKIHRLEKKAIANKLYNYIKQNNLSIDIIETHDFEGLSLYLDNSTPYVVRCHGSYSILGTYFGYKFDIGRVQCEKEAFKKAKNIIAISEFSIKANTELFGINKFELIYNGIDTDKFIVNKQSKIIQKSIFFFGNISIEKGADIAIQAFVALIKTEPDATLHFLGKEGKYTNELVKIIKNQNIEEKVFFYGIKNTKEAIEIISKAAVVICPSKGETFGLALCETMSLSKPVVTSNIESFQEIIENRENGYIANNIEEYVSYISYLFENEEESQTIGLQARNTIIEKFSLDKTIQNSLDYYTKVMDDFKS